MHFFVFKLSAFYKKWLKYKFKLMLKMLYFLDWLVLKNHSSSVGVGILKVDYGFHRVYGMNEYA